MTSKEYSEAIYAIVSSGRGYKAIADINGYLENMSHNTNLVIKELRAERKAVRKICESTVSNREKVAMFLLLTKEDTE